MGVWSWHLWVDPRCKGQKDLCWALEVWADLSTKPLMSVVWVTSMDLESEWIGSWDFSGRGELVAVSRNLTYFESGKKPRLTVVYHLSLQRGSGLWNYAMWGQALRTPLLFSAFSEYLAESGTWLNGMWQHGVLSWSHHPHTVCPGASHLHFPYMSREKGVMGDYLDENSIPWKLSPECGYKVWGWIPGNVPVPVSLRPEPFSIVERWEKPQDTNQLKSRLWSPKIHTYLVCKICISMADSCWSMAETNMIL